MLILYVWLYVSCLYVCMYVSSLCMCVLVRVSVDSVYEGQSKVHSVEININIADQIEVNKSISKS